ncbi:DUF1178 family protein [Roseomonas sp. M0104]|uniref:DUF1178 family protein n=1 Tax=Teichococcus coralli TaxID=2545983 RepID=A0A845B606_9PROT|nr:DUF1178 family protein [Pseudoroseomonas coralli]MXP61740.1 DUF1178 family protein [Pseudoroseomonas coralli]
MIHYQLRCDQNHGFDGWYKDSVAFEKLARAGLIDCPVCGGTKVERALMAPALGKGRAAEAPPPAAVPPADAGKTTQAAAGPMPAQVLALLQRMRAEVEKSCDYVGHEFADEARRIHRGESERRGIYGETSDTEAEALRKEGVDIAQLPWVPRADS